MPIVSVPVLALLGTELGLSTRQDVVARGAPFHALTIFGQSGRIRDPNRVALANFLRRSIVRKSARMPLPTIATASRGCFEVVESWACSSVG